MSLLKSILKSVLPADLIRKLQERKQIIQWKNSNNAISPPHIIKQKVISSYSSRFNTATLVETGTYFGDMVEAQKKRFDKVYSIELSQELYQKAVQRFKKDANVTILQGDSGKVLHSVVKEINGPALFWLDGHYSAGVTARGETDCPIFGELDAILSVPPKGDVILIDDARLFIGEGDYPTVKKVTEYIRSKYPSAKEEVKDDIIRYVLKEI